MEQNKALITALNLGMSVLQERVHNCQICTVLRHVEGIKWRKYVESFLNDDHFTAREDMKSTNLPFNVWLHSSVGWALHRCRECHEFESR